MKFRSLFVTLICLFTGSAVVAQRPASLNASDIFLGIQKLKVLGSVLYIAAHPDDENTRLLAWLSRDQLLRTGYLSLTRGDGGQNLIGGEQGIELGLVRTQELLSARRIDGAEQFFSRAYDFGFSKNTAEALSIWNKEKILSDVVWVIRKFQPDIIITRFPDDNRAGHGHHSASSALAKEAFTAAADKARFPEQFNYGVKAWQAKRILWNTYNFGENNTIRPGQMSVDVGGFNPLLGKSYGEISAQSRSQHKSQGFGSAYGRGTQFEYFSHTAGSEAKTGLEEGVDISWRRIGTPQITAMIDKILQHYSQANPQLSVPALVKLYQTLNRLPKTGWLSIKLHEVQQLIEACSGLWLEVFSSNQFSVQGDSLKLNVSVIVRSGSGFLLTGFRINQVDSVLSRRLEKNIPSVFSSMLYVPDSLPVSQPYWLRKSMSDGSYTVDDQTLIGNAGAAPAFMSYFKLLIEGQDFIFEKPVLYKHTDPVKGELYQPIIILPAVNVSVEPEIILAHKKDSFTKEILVNLLANRVLKGYSAVVSIQPSNDTPAKVDSAFTLASGASRSFSFPVPKGIARTKQEVISTSVVLSKGDWKIMADQNLHGIQYDHIPDIWYFKKDAVKLINEDIDIAGKKIGYIEGAGDKVPAALRLMGYDVTILREQDLRADQLAGFDAIITGIRAYNVHYFLSEKNEVLKSYIRNGGNLIVQYNTNNEAGPMRAKIGPYNFNISRNRVTDEHSPVAFTIPDHQVFSYPNKITSADFDSWIQERAIYFADNLDSAFVTPLSMNDPGEEPNRGGLIIADYGKGKFVYTSLVFFRELPAGVPGAYRLLANIIALNKRKNSQ